MENLSFKIKTTIMGYFQYKSSNELAFITTKSIFNNIVNESIKQIEIYESSSKQFIEII